MCSAIRAIAVVILMGGIAACGGGGGSGDGGAAPAVAPAKTLTQLQAEFDQKRRAVYEGLTTQAELNESSFLEFLRVYFAGFSGAVNSVGTKLTVSEKDTSGVAHSLFSHERIADKVQAFVQASAKKTEIEESVACDNVDGLMHLTGTIDGPGVGFVTLQFDNCELDGGIFNGPGIYYLNRYSSDEIFMERVQVTKDGLVSHFTGRMQYGRGFSRYNLTVEIDATGEKFQLEDLTKNTVDSGATTGVSIDGRIFLSERGYAVINGNYSETAGVPIGEGNLTVNGADDGRGIVEFKPPYAKFLLRNSGASSFGVGVVVEMSGLVLDETLNIEYIAVENVNYPPLPPSFSFASQKFKPKHAVNILVGNIVDFDGDAVGYSCRWYLNGIEISAVTGCQFPANTAKHDDLVEVALVLDDGKSRIETPRISTRIDNSAPPPTVLFSGFLDEKVTVLTDVRALISFVTTEIFRDPTYVMFSMYRWYLNGQLLDGYTDSTLPAGVAKKGDRIDLVIVLDDGFQHIEFPAGPLIVGDAISQVDIGTLPEQIEVGQAISAQASHTDPDVDDPVGLPFELAYGPENASVSANGRLDWTPDNMYFDVQTFHFGIQVAGQSETLRDVAVRVVDSTTQAPLMRTAIYGDIVAVGQFDDEPGNEILMRQDTFYGTSSVYTVKSSGSDYVQNWVYPYELSCYAMAAGDVDADGILEIICAGVRGIHLLNAGSSKIETIVDESYYNIAALATGDVDADGGVDLVVLGSSTTGSRAGPFVTVFDLQQKSIELEIPYAVYGSQLRVGNVDEDDALEIAVDDGRVFDGVSGEIEWSFAGGFGANFDIANVTGSARGEIVATRWYAPGILVLDAVSKSVLWSDLTVPVSSLVVIDTDDDGWGELVIRSCRPSSVDQILVFDADGSQGTLQHRLEIEATAGCYDPIQFAVGDTNGDSNLDVVTQNSYPQLMVTDFSDAAQQWTGAAESQLKEFSGAGVGHDNFGEPWVAFSVQDRPSVLVGSRIVKMDLSGQLDVSEAFCDSTYCGGGALVTDADGDGDFEFFVDIYRPTILNDVTYDVVWSTGLGSASLLPVDADLNGDGYKELFYLDTAWEFYPRLALRYGPDYGTEYRFDDGLGPFTAGDLDGDGMAEVFAGQKVYKRIDDGFELMATIPDACALTEMVDIDSAGGAELVCVKPPEYVGSMESLQTVVVYSSAELTEIRRFNLPFVVTDIEFADSGAGYKDMIVATRGFRQDSDGSSQYAIAQVSFATGGVVWSSPRLLGEVSPNGLHVFRDTDNRRHFSMATPTAVYLTQ